MLVPELAARVARLLEPIYEREGAWRQLVGTLRAQRTALGPSLEAAQLLARIAVVEEEKLSATRSAFEAWSEVLAIDPADERARKAAIRLAVAHGRVAEAATVLDKAAAQLLRDSSGDVATRVAVLGDLAVLYDRELADADKAIATYQQQLEADPANAAVVRGSGGALSELLHDRERWSELREVLRRRAEWANNGDEAARAAGPGRPPRGREAASGGSGDLDVAGHPRRAPGRSAGAERAGAAVHRQAIVGASSSRCCAVAPRRRTRPPRRAACVTASPRSTSASCPTPRTRSAPTSISSRTSPATSAPWPSWRGCTAPPGGAAICWRPSRSSASWRAADGAGSWTARSPSCWAARWAGRPRRWSAGLRCSATATTSRPTPTWRSAVGRYRRSRRRSTRSTCATAPPRSCDPTTWATTPSSRSPRCISGWPSGATRRGRGCARCSTWWRCASAPAMSPAPSPRSWRRCATPPPSPSCRRSSPTPSAWPASWRASPS